MQTTIRNIFILALISFLTLLPMIFIGVFEGPDTSQHIQFASTYETALLSGDVFPSWGANENFGYGSVGVRFYPPIFSILIALAHALTDNWHTSIWLVKPFIYSNWRGWRLPVSKRIHGRSLPIACRNHFYIDAISPVRNLYKFVLCRICWMLVIAIFISLRYANLQQEQPFGCLRLRSLVFPSNSHTRTIDRDHFDRLTSLFIADNPERKISTNLSEARKCGRICFGSNVILLDEGNHRN